VPHPAPPARGLGVHGGLGGDTARAADPADQRDIPHPMVSYSAKKAGEEGGSGGTFGAIVFIFPSHRYV